MHFLQPNIIDLELERKKRFNPCLNAIRLVCALEETLGETPAENYPLVLREFIAAMDLGEQPLTVLATVCRNNADVLQMLSTLLSDVPLDVHVYLLESIEKLYPGDKDAVARLKMMVVTLYTREISLETFGQLFSVNPELYLIRYILGEDSHFERYAMLSNANVIKFPKKKKKK